VPGDLPCVLVVLYGSGRLEVAEETPQLGLPCLVEGVFACRCLLVLHVFVHERLALATQHGSGLGAASLQEVAHDCDARGLLVERLVAPDGLLPHLEPLEDLERTAHDAEREQPDRELAFHLPLARQRNRVHKTEPLADGRVRARHLVDKRLQLQHRALDGARAVRLESRA
jgi:hypothetical protein